MRAQGRSECRGDERRDRLACLLCDTFVDAQKQQPLCNIRCVGDSISPKRGTHVVRRHLISSLEVRDVRTQLGRLPAGGCLCGTNERSEGAISIGLRHGG